MPARAACAREGGKRYDSKMSESKAMIVGLRGHSVSEEERAFFLAERPWGYILFARNIADAAQLRALTAELRALSGDPKTPILIDQEGGRVQRLRPPLAPNYPPAAEIGVLYRRDGRAGRRAAWLQGRLHAFDLTGYGINVDCLPVLDIPVPGSHDVIGNRAYGEEPESVAALAGAAMEGLVAGGVLPIVKHIPGHGRAGADSHLSLPVVDTPRDELDATDFRPFAAHATAPMAMTAHVVYSAVDAENPATTSRRMIDDVIRGAIGFDGLLMSDDVSMKALAGDFASRTRAIFAAGCDMALHCNGDLDEMREVAAETPRLAGDALRRADAAIAALAEPDDSREDALREEFDALMRVTA